MEQTAKNPIDQEQYNYWLAQLQSIEQKQYSNISLEELREKQKKFLLRGEDRNKPMTDRELQYWEKVLASRSAHNPFDDLLADLERQEDVKPEITPWLDYQEAKQALWFFMKKIAQKKQFTWVMYDGLKELCELMAAYFSGHSASGLDLHKGFFIYGSVGGGKSELLKACQMMAQAYNVQGRMFKIAEAERIVQETQRVDEAHLGQYYRGNWCFDDMGNTNMTYQYMGNVINPMQTIFTKRSRTMQVSYITTHVTSNVGPDDYKGAFDDRVVSRFYQMFNIYALDSPEDFRRR